MKQNTPRLFILDYTISMTGYYLCGGALVAKLTEYFSLPLALANVVVGLPSTLMMVELFGGFAFSRAQKPLRYLRVGNLLWRLLLPLVFFSVLLPKSVGGAVMAASFFAMCAMLHFMMPSYNAWMVDATQGKVKANYYSMRDLLFMVVFTLASFGAGMLVSRGQHGGTLTISFALLGVLEVFFLLCSLRLLLRRLPAPADTQAAARKLSFVQAVLQPLRDTAYRKVLYINSMWNFGSMFICSFSAMYQVRVLQLDYLSIVLWTAATNIARMLVIPLFAKIGDRFGWKAATQLSLVIMLLHAGVWMAVTPANAAVLAPVGMLISGLPFAALGIGIFKFQIAYTTNENRSTYFSMAAATGGLSAALGSVGCSALLGLLEVSFAAPPFWVVFLVGIVCTVLTMLLIHCTPYTEK